MRCVVQKVTQARVTVEGEITGEIKDGYMVLVGAEDGDVEADVTYCAEKISGLRVFEDADDKMNLALADVGGGALVVSNFTLGADYSHGNRPSFFDSAPPAEAEVLYEEFVALLKERVPHVACGVFGADMEITMKADGPVTIVMDSQKLGKGKKA